MKINGINTAPQMEHVLESKKVAEQHFQEDKVLEKPQLPEVEKIDRKDLDEDMLEKSIKQANKSLLQVNRFIEREVHEVTHAVMYTLKDVQTQEIIAEFPPKKIQDMIAKMWELAGLFVDEKA